MDTKKTTIVVFCAWCGKPLGTKDGEGVSGVSHGICPDCARQFLNELSQPQAAQKPAA
jgi:hypothetical protein